VLYESVDGLPTAIQEFELMDSEIRASELQAWARTFSVETFIARMTDVLRPFIGAPPLGGVQPLQQAKIIGGT
jgi:hypothetical protein